ncbi:MAG: hypothetical protein U0457_16240 [Candidatus Sericytochromatia bacterium]
MLGGSKDPEKKGTEQPKKIPSPPAFGSKPAMGGAPQGAAKTPISAPPSNKPGMDNFQRTNKAQRGITAPLSNANSNLNLTSENREFTETKFDDGIVILKYKEPQKIDNLIKDAKARVGGENSKFFSKGWVIGTDIAKIAPDGQTITFYPKEVSDLVQELIGYPSTDDNK